MLNKVDLVSEKSKRIAEKLFPNDYEYVIERLQFVCEISADWSMSRNPNPKAADYERVCFALLKAGGGSLEKFKDAVFIGMHDSKEVFPLAGFSESITIHRKWGEKILND